MSQALINELCTNNDSRECGGGFLHVEPLYADEYAPGGGHVSRVAFRRLSFAWLDSAMDARSSAAAAAASACGDA